MTDKSLWKQRLQFGLLGAFAYCIPVVFYIRDATYRQTWLLFLGVFFFLIVAIIHTLQDSRKRRQNVKTFRLIYESHVITIIAIIIACLLCFILLTVLVPGYLGGGPAAKALPDNPPNDLFDKTNGMSQKIFLTGVVGNFSAGSFVGIIVPFYSSRAGGKTSAEVAPLKQ